MTSCWRGDISASGETVMPRYAEAPENRFVVRRAADPSWVEKTPLSTERVCASVKRAVPPLGAL